MCLLPVTEEGDTSVMPRIASEADDAAVAGRLEKEDVPVDAAIGDAAIGDADGDSDGDEKCRIWTDEVDETPLLATRRRGESPAAAAPTGRAMKRQGLSYLCAVLGSGCQNAACEMHFTYMRRRLGGGPGSLLLRRSELDSASASQK